MAAVLIAIWVMANDSTTTQSVEVASLDACHRAKSILIETTRPLLHEGSFLEDVQFACQERDDSTDSASSSARQTRRHRDQ